ncbi:MAG: nucleoside transporter C-terminal domain-containing protein [Planctomycetota bacterium]
MGQFTGLLGVAGLLLVAFALSSDRRQIRPRIIIVGVSLQFVLAFLLLRFEPVVAVYRRIALAFTHVLDFSERGAVFVFGNLPDDDGPWGFVFAAKVLPVIVFFASATAVLYHLGVMQKIVGAFAWSLQRSLGVTGEEALACAANMFVGQTEAPLCIRPFISRLTRSQLMLVMTGGFATIAGSVLSAFVLILGGDDPAQRVAFAQHLLTASAMSAPGAFVMAKLMIPEVEDHRSGSAAAVIPTETSNVLDAAAVGATDGLKLSLNVAAMLIAFVALLALLDWPITAFGGTPLGDRVEAVLGLEALSLSSMLGLLFLPVAYGMGLVGSDALAVGSLLGTSMIATEFVAYLQLGDLVRDGGETPVLSARAAAVASFALCGFANIPSIAIQIGGLSALAPERRADIAALGPRAMLAGAMTCWMTGCIASIVLPAATAS